MSYDGFHNWLLNHYVIYHRSIYDIRTKISLKRKMYKTNKIQQFEV